jgi:class 3 adenylate cyclase
MTHSGTVTLLFTDIVNSTELLHRAGDESAQRVFEAHHKLLSAAVAANGGHEVKWLGEASWSRFLRLPPQCDAPLQCSTAPGGGSRGSACRFGLGCTSATRSRRKATAICLAEPHSDAGRIP